MRWHYGLVFWLGSLISTGVTAATSAAPLDFSLPDLDGQVRHLTEFRGKWVVVNYWATWCPPCLEELPELELFHHRHAAQDAVVLGINSEGLDIQRLRAFVEHQFLSFPILRDRARSRTELGAIPGLPTSFLIAPDGRLMARQVGPLTATQLEQLIQRLRVAVP